MRRNNLDGKKRLQSASLSITSIPLVEGGGGGGPAGSGREHGGGGGNVGASSTFGSILGGGGITNEDDITSPLVSDVVIPLVGDTPLGVTPFIDDVIEPIGVAGWRMDCKGREEGGGGGMDSDGAPSGLRWNSVSSLLSSSISSASTFSN